MKLPVSFLSEMVIVYDFSMIFIYFIKRNRWAEDSQQFIKGLLADWSQDIVVEAKAVQTHQCCEEIQNSVGWVNTDR